MHVRMLKRKLKSRPRKLRPVRRCLLSTFTLTTCRSFIILNFIYARKASQIQGRKLCKILATVKIHPYQHFLNTKLGNMQHQIFSHKLLLKEKYLNVLLWPFYSVLLFFFFFRYSKLYHHAN